MFSLICVWINDWVNNREAGDLWRYRGHYDSHSNDRRWVGIRQTAILFKVNLTGDVQCRSVLIITIVIPWPKAIETGRQALVFFTNYNPSRLFSNRIGSTKWSHILPRSAMIECHCCTLILLLCQKKMGHILMAVATAAIELVHYLSIEFLWLMRRSVNSWG